MTTRSILRRSVPLAAAALALCIGSFGQEEPQEPGLSEGPAKAQLELRYAEGDEARYKFDQHSYVVMKGVPGLPPSQSGQPLEIQAKGVLYEKLLDVTEDGNYEMKTGFERAHILQGERVLSFGPEDLPSATVVLDKLGNLIATKTSYLGSPIIANQPWTSTARPPSSWVVLSGKGVSPDSKWTAQMPLPLTGLSEQPPRVSLSCQVEGFEEMQGSECARIFVTARGPVELKGVPVYGALADVTLDFAITATAWVRTSDGRLVRIEESGRQSMIGTPAAEEDQGQTAGTQFEMGLDSTITAELIPQED